MLAGIGLELRTRSVLLLRDQDQPLALARIWGGDDGGWRQRPQLRGQHLHGRERDHFAADLGEPFGTALDRDKALGIERDDVASVMPALWRWLQNAGPVDLEVAQHYVRP